MLEAKLARLNTLAYAGDEYMSTLDHIRRCVQAQACSATEAAAVLSTCVGSPSAELYATQLSLGNSHLQQPDVQLMVARTTSLKVAQDVVLVGAELFEMPNKNKVDAAKTVEASRQVVIEEIAADQANWDATDSAVCILRILSHMVVQGSHVPWSNDATHAAAVQLLQLLAERAPAQSTLARCDAVDISS